MAGASTTRLHSAFAAATAACDALEAAASRTAGRRGSVESELAASWQAHSEQLEGALAEAVSENSFLKEDNLRLSNQLASLQREYIALQKAAAGTLVRLDESVKQIDLILEH